jgi:penicillin-binding protein 1A
VAIEPQSGRVLAMVGGYSYALSSFNRATQAERQPGSAFKPIVYATALETGDFTPASVVLDAPISFAGGANGGRWTPENYSKEYYGPSTLRRGLELSRNVMTVRLASTIGMPRIIDLAKKMGVSDTLQPNLSVSLGAGETTPFRLTAAYAAFVNGGRRVDPYLIEMVQDRNGETVYRADRRQCRDCDRGFSGQPSPRLEPRGTQVIDPITAYQISSMLEGVVQRGTAASARASAAGSAARPERPTTTARPGSSASRPTSSSASSSASTTIVRWDPARPAPRRPCRSSPTS